MVPVKNNSKIYYYSPKNLPELFKIMKSIKNYRLYFDDINFTEIRSVYVGDNDSIIQHYIYMGFIEELLQMKRGERYFDIGTEVTVNHLIQKGQNALPVLLLKALKGCALPNVRNIVTLGGIICKPDIRNNVFTVLSLLNAKLEISSSIAAGTKKVIPVQQFFKDGEMELASGEVISRIRIPYENYDVTIFKEIKDADKKICFYGIANTFKNSVSMCKFAIGNWGDSIIKDKGIESSLIDQKIPVSEKDLEVLERQMFNLLETEYTSLSPYAQTALTNIFVDFLKKL